MANNRLTGRILDFGSGICEYDDILGADSVDDYDAEQSRKAQDHLDKVSPGCKFFGQWVTVDNPLPVPDNYYHVIRLGYSWGWMGKNFVKTGPELVRILAPSGTIIAFDAAINEEDHGIGSIKELENHFREALPGCFIYLQGRETEDGIEFNLIAEKGRI